MWEDLLKVGTGAWESIAEGAETYINVWAETKAQSDAEDRKNPELLNQATPQTGTRTDGSTITESRGFNGQAPIINGVSNTALMVGGALIVGLLFVMKGD